VGQVGSPPHAAPQLIKLGQAEAVGAVNNQRIDVGHIQPRLDDGGADQDITLALGKLGHHPFQLALGHLSVGNRYSGLGHQVLKLGGDEINALHAVVDEEDLPVALQFS